MDSVFGEAATKFIRIYTIYTNNRLEMVHSQQSSNFAGKEWALTTVLNSALLAETLKWVGIVQLSCW